MIKFIKEFNRPLLYGLLIFMGLFALNQILFDYGVNSFVKISIFFTAICLLLLFLDHQSHLKKYNQRELFLFEKEYYFKHLINHYLIPITLFVLTILFMFFNTNAVIKLLVISISSIAIVICLINLRSYFLNKLLIEAKTHTIYDGMKILIFYLFANVLLHIQIVLRINTFIILLLFFILTILGIVLMFIRREIFHKQVFLISIAGSSIISLTYILTHRVLNFNLLQTNVILLCFFYFLTALIHHRLERTLNKEIVFNYILFMSMTVLIIFGMR